jgi:hypothetical protein
LQYLTKKLFLQNICTIGLHRRTFATSITAKATKQHEMKYTGVLNWEQDEETGVWGFMPKQDWATDTPFNTFLEASGLFHDVFEHYFEGEVKPFIGGTKVNTAYGEVCATGHRLYWYDRLGFTPFKYRKYAPSSLQEKDFMADTLHLFQEHKSDGYSMYSVKPLRIPYKPAKHVKNANMGIDYLIEEYKNELVKAGYKKNDQECTDVANALRMGYNMAFKKWNRQEYSTMIDFFESFLDFAHKMCENLKQAEQNAMINAELYSYDEETEEEEWNGGYLHSITVQVDTCKPSFKITAKCQEGKTYKIHHPHQLSAGF